jgi:MFS family permease
MTDPFKISPRPLRTFAACSPRVRQAWRSSTPKRTSCGRAQWRTRRPPPTSPGSRSGGTWRCSPGPSPPTPRRSSSRPQSRRSASLGLLDVEGLLGLGPALVLAAGALAAVPAGRAMDRRGRIPVLAAGFALGAASCGLAALGSADGSPVAVLAGLIGVGIANGPARLIRTAGGDMYPPERRARGIALVLFGGILGPGCLRPLAGGA